MVDRRTGSGAGGCTGARACRGAVTPLVAVLVVVVAGLGLGLGRLGSQAVAVGQARAAADAAALAGAAGGREAAETVAAANGATVVDYHEAAGRVTVEVRRGDATARASATSDGTGSTGSPGPLP